MEGTRCGRSRGVYTVGQRREASGTYPAMGGSALINCVFALSFIIVPYSGVRRCCGCALRIETDATLVARVWWCEPGFASVVACTRRPGVPCNGELGPPEAQI